MAMSKLTSPARRPNPLDDRLRHSLQLPRLELFPRELEGDLLGRSLEPGVVHHRPPLPTEPDADDLELSVSIRMMDGSELEGRIKNFDRFALILDQAGTDHLIFKHAIAAIKTPKAVSNYFSHQ